MNERVMDLMDGGSKFCGFWTSIEDVARLLVECECGAIPIVEDESLPFPVGIVTEGDIVRRIVATGENPKLRTAGECMSYPCVAVSPYTRIKTCREIMEMNRVRRVVVVDEDGCCCGMLSQSDIARRVMEAEKIARRDFEMVTAEDRYLRAAYEAEKYRNVLVGSV